MLFVDDDARDDYHKSPALLQVVCSLFESELAKQTYQVEVLDSQHDRDQALAMLCICPINDENAPIEESMLNEVLRSLNSQFRRIDGIPTIKVESEDLNIIHVRVTASRDFAQLT